MKPIHEFYEFNYGVTKYQFLRTGDIFEFTQGNVMINQFRGNPKEGSVNNIYLRIYKEDIIHYYPLLGIHSKSALKLGENSLVYYGEVENISYEVTFRGAEQGWFWEVALSGCGETVDLLYGQDIGNANRMTVLTNELYTAQYLGHSVFSTKQGYVICSRQNMEQDGKFPCIQQGTLGVKALHYSTDGMQFFGINYKATNQPEIVSKDLPDENYQFELAYIGLQTERFNLDIPRNAVFYGYIKENLETAVTDHESIDIIDKLLQTMPKDEQYKDGTHIKYNDLFGAPYASLEMSKNEIDQLFPDRMLEEKEEGKLLSFFTNDHSHIVTQHKELLTERPHGTIITTCFDTKKVNSNLITSTNYMYGLFHGQTVIGNTSFHKFLSTPRGLLNIQKNSGQRLYVKIEGVYRLLTLPALYEMGMNYSRWFYMMPEDLLIVTAFAAANKPDMILEVSSQQKKSYDFILTNQLVLGENEYSHEIEAAPIPHGLRFYVNSKEYPGLHYDLQFPNTPVEYDNDSIFFSDHIARDETFLTVSMKDQSYFQCIISGNLEEAPVLRPKAYSLKEEKDLYHNFYQQLNQNFNLKSPLPELQKQLDILNQTAWWYSHNAVVHFAVPHGLEQPGGAAWGTRDVCQGPMEYFLMTRHYSLAADVLKNIFAHQYNSSGEWPQWFMFDRYSIDAGECHGDVVFWPLKCISDYIRCSGDYSLLQQQVPYLDEPGREESILQHIKRAFASISERFIRETGLITYAGGDWDDTLQPADPAMKEHLISSWTVALAFQTLSNLEQVIRKIDEDFSSLLTRSVEKIQRDFKALLIKDKVIAGFVKFEQEKLSYMLHPQDMETGIQYRLIPMTRSIIAELVDRTQAEINLEIVEQKLKFPDGVRLMDQPAQYNGGVSKLFKRAEQAANVGREISLQYTHAHIRYLEACAKIGKGKDAWEGLFTINPILIRETVPNANVRQSNLYFSSSDGFFLDRYDYTQNFNQLKSGTVPVKGGWRLYSSGPGIYLNQLISNILGIRFAAEYLILDPVLPKYLEGLEFTYQCFDKMICFHYHFGEDNLLQAKCKGNLLPSIQLNNPYRRGGIQIHRDVLVNCSTVIDLYL
jgi:cellobiose phosphorylase